MSYPYRVIVALDMFLNVLCLGGVPDETISAHAGRLRKRNDLWAVLLNKFLNLIQPGHCDGAIQGDLDRAEVVEKLEEDSQKIR